MQWGHEVPCQSCRPDQSLLAGADSAAQGYEHVGAVSALIAHHTWSLFLLQAWRVRLHSDITRLCSLQDLRRGVTANTSRPWDPALHPHAGEDASDCCCTEACWVSDGSMFCCTTKCNTVGVGGANGAGAKVAGDTCSIAEGLAGGTAAVAPPQQAPRCSRFRVSSGTGSFGGCRVRSLYAHNPLPLLKQPATVIWCVRNT